jgi:molybdate transport system regulatory protein
MASTRPKAVSFTEALSHASADKRIDILRLIARGGSISQAGREAGVSYKAAWQAIDTLTNLAGVPLVEKVVGGAGGGGARITAAGVQLLAAADEVAKARKQVFSRLGKGAPVMEQLGIRTSMRNQLPCEVVSMEGAGHIVSVRLALPGGAAVVSRITRESAELLALKPGQRVLAMCKATAVSVALAGQGRAAKGINRLEGKASRVSRGDGEDEVAVEVAPGIQLVGFAAAGSGIRARSKAVARIDESAVVIGWTG